MGDEHIFRLHFFLVLIRGDRIYHQHQKKQWVIQTCAGYFYKIVIHSLPTLIIENLLKKEEEEEQARLCELKLPPGGINADQ